MHGGQENVPVDLGRGRGSAGPTLTPSAYGLDPSLAGGGPQSSGAPPDPVVHRACAPGLS